MPTFDGGHYYLTCLAPVRTETIGDESAETSPVHALRKRLDLLHGDQRSPFARNTRNHFARFTVIDDVAYNGRDTRDTLVSAARRYRLIRAQPQDHLTCPFLLFAVDFDARSGADGERDSYLGELWRTAEKEMRDIFQFCRDFEKTVKDEKTFAAYLARAQLETTMSFNDYTIDPLNLPSWPAGRFKWAAIASGGALLIGLVVTIGLFVAELFAGPLVAGLRTAVGLTLVGAVALAIVAAAAYASVMKAGAKPFPSAPGADLPTILDALGLQSRFRRFAIDSQAQAAARDAASAQKLYDEFAIFIAQGGPGAAPQAPGVIGE